MDKVNPRSIVRDVLIGFGVGIALMVSIGMVATAFAGQPDAPAATAD